MITTTFEAVEYSGKSSGERRAGYLSTLQQDILLRTQTSPVQARIMETGRTANPRDRSWTSIPLR